MNTCSLAKLATKQRPHNLTIRESVRTHRSGKARKFNNDYFLAPRAPIQNDTRFPRSRLLFLRVSCASFTPTFLGLTDALIRAVVPQRGRALQVFFSATQGPAHTVAPAPITIAASLPDTSAPLRYVATTFAAAPRAKHGLSNLLEP